MRIRLLRDSRREGKAGEIVEVSPERLAFLLSIGAAEEVTEAGERAEAPKAAEAKAEKKPAEKAKKTTAKKSTAAKVAAKPAKKPATVKKPAKVAKKPAKK